MATTPDDRRRHVTAAHVAHRRNAAARYIERLRTTWPPLPPADRRALADLLLAEQPTDSR